MKLSFYAHFIKYCLLLVFTLCTAVCFAQVKITGKILDKENNPVAGATVHVKNTNISTATDEKGNFSLDIKQPLPVTLIVSSIGYETNAQSISSTASAFITIKLKLKTEVMETVVIEPYEKDGWKKWGSFFMESFIGTSSLASNCPCFTVWPARM